MERELANSFMPIIQLAITPVIMLSGVGALMITLTNRMGRVVDRTRQLAEKIQKAEGEERYHLEQQLSILWRRAKLVRHAVTFAGLSMLLSCVLIVIIFFDAALPREFIYELVGVFILSVVMLIAALVSFLRDIFVSLAALHLEVQRARAKQ